MPSTERYALNELQLATLEVLAGQIMPTGLDAEARPSVPRDEIIAAVQATPGLDDVTGNAMGPCLAALKRRGLVLPAKGTADHWYITAQGMGYVEGAESEEDETDPGSDAPLSAPAEPETSQAEPEPAPVVSQAEPEPAPVVSQAEPVAPPPTEPAPADDLKQCQGCGVTFRRPDDSPIPDDHCERCHAEIEAYNADYLRRLADRVGAADPASPAEPAASDDPVSAADILRAGLGHMQDRAATYDRPEGERSMGATVRAFSAITGIAMTEEQGWLFMVLLKAVRSQQGGYRADSYEDGAAYFALAGESAAAAREVRA